MKPLPRRGDVFWARLEPTEGSEQQGQRPVLVVSLDAVNAKQRVFICVCLTTKSHRLPPLAIEVKVVSDKRSFALPGQIRALSASRFGQHIGRVSEEDIQATLDGLMQLCGRRPRVPEWKADNDG